MHSHEERSTFGASDWSRRDFLKAGGLGTLGLAAGDLMTTGARAVATSSGRAGSVIFISLVGGPSQLETFDPKPDAPSEIRGPFGSIPTAVPGVRISEYLPGLARRMDRLTLVRSMTHSEAPIHETGHQLLNTGGLSQANFDRPHFGSVAFPSLATEYTSPRFVMIPGPIGHTGVCVPRGQGAGMLDTKFSPYETGSEAGSAAYNASVIARQGGVVGKGANPFDLDAERGATRDAYGRTTLGQGCLLARRLVESGTRVVALNMFDTVFNKTTWDAHGRKPFSTLDDYRQTLLPTLDLAISALVDDLQGRGLLESTLIVATGEFGRSPKLNQHGGRDHWPTVWTALLAGGGLPGGQVIGASDDHAAEPYERPVDPVDLTATIYRVLGVDPNLVLNLKDGKTLAIAPNAHPLI